MEIRDKFAPIRKGLLELAVLKVINAHNVYAADILMALANSDFSTQDGTLYPLLNRLQREGAVAHEWVESEHGPPRKYYHLTLDGHQQLQSLEAYFLSLQKTLANFDKPANL